MADSPNDNIKFTDPGPPITPEQLHQLEQEIGSVFPDPLRRDLLTYNGGRPIPKTFEVKGHPERLFDIQLFYGVSREIESSNIAWHLQVFRDLVKRKLIPFARTDTGDLLLLDLHDGSVVFWDALEENLDQRYYRVAESYAAFLENLHTPDEDMLLH